MEIIRMMVELERTQSSGTKENQQQEEPQNEELGKKQQQEDEEQENHEKKKDGSTKISTSKEATTKASTSTASTSTAQASTSTAKTLNSTNSTAPTSTLTAKTSISTAKTSSPIASTSAAKASTPIASTSAAKASTSTAKKIDEIEASKKASTSTAEASTSTSTTTKQTASTTTTTKIITYTQENRNNKNNLKNTPIQDNKENPRKRKRESKLTSTNNLGIKGIQEIKGGFENKIKRNIEIPGNIKTLLSLGEKFVIPYKKHNTGDLVEMIQDIENIWDEINIEGKIFNINKWKNELIEELITGNTKFGKTERDILHTVIELERFMKNNKDICILQADKGKKTIMMETAEFNRMARIFMEKALNKGLYILEDEIKKEMEQRITNREIAKFKQNVSKWKKAGIYINRNEKFIGKENQFWDHILNVNEKIPRMSFIIKAHKEEGLQIRNICPKNNAWTHQLSTILSTILYDAINDNMKEINYQNYNILNIQNFAKQLQQTTIGENEEITIVDIKEMFNEIDTKQLMNIIYRFINKEKFNHKTIMEMTKYDLTEANWIMYKNNLYKQNQGIPMGAPTSTIYASIFLDYYITINYEEMTRKGLKNIFKYVDDILIINEKGRANDIIQILERDTGLKCNIEKNEKNEKNESEHTFLDMKILIEEGGNLKTCWNKKAYVSNRIINASSTQSWTTKIATISNRIQRTIDLTNDTLLYEALQINIEELINNGYNLTTIINVLKKTKNSNNKKIGNEGMDNNTDMDNDNKKEIENKIKIIEDCIESIRIQKQINIREKNKDKNEREENKNKNNMHTKRKTSLGPYSNTRKKNLLRNAIKRNTNDNTNTKYIRTPFRNEKDLLNTKKTIRKILKQKQNQNFAVKKNKNKEMKNLIREKFRDSSKTPKAPRTPKTPKPQKTQNHN